MYCEGKCIYVLENKNENGSKNEIKKIILNVRFIFIFIF